MSGWISCLVDFFFNDRINDCTQPENAITRVVKKEVKKKVRKLRGRSDSDTDDDEFEDDLVRDGKREKFSHVPRVFDVKIKQGFRIEKNGRKGK